MGRHIDTVHLADPLGDLKRVRTVAAADIETALAAEIRKAPYQAKAALDAVRSVCERTTGHQSSFHRMNLVSDRQ
jgi:hypothetical protein